MSLAATRCLLVTLLALAHQAVLQPCFRSRYHLLDSAHFYLHVAFAGVVQASLRRSLLAWQLRVLFCIAGALLTLLAWL